MAQVTFPTEYGGDGQTYSDASFRSGGHRQNFIPALNNSLAMATFAKNKAEECEQLRDDTAEFFQNIDPFKPTVYLETVGTVSGNDVQLNTGNMFFDTVSSSKTYTFSSPPSSGTAYSFTLIVEVSGSVVIGWPSSVKWPEGVSPSLPDSGETFVCVFFTADAGSTYYGFVSGERMS